MPRLFGTDGVRGVVNQDLTPELATRLAQAAVAVTPRRRARPLFLVGRDTRLSGTVLEAAVAAGLSSAGAETVLAGVLSTPASALLAKRRGFDGAVMITASHNTYEHNGLKFFGPQGEKLSERCQDEIEVILEDFAHRPRTREVGGITHQPELVSDYVEYLLGVGIGGLAGLHVVLDCAHGALHEIAPDALTRMGAEVTRINCSPDGRNINEGGALKPQVLARAVRDQSADIGIAFDGDGDRIVLADDRGRVLDGDHILALWADDLVRRGHAPGPVVGTVVSNGGLGIFLSSIGCQLIRAPVGDRHVAAQMQRAGSMLGGEPSGHIIHLPYLTSSDGLYVAAVMLDLLTRAGRPLSALAARLPRRPQIHRNIPTPVPREWRADPVLRHKVAEAEAALAERGRIVVRPSGTEPVIRLMVESETENEARAIACDLSDAIRRRLPAREAARC